MFVSLRCSNFHPKCGSTTHKRSANFTRDGNKANGRCGFRLTLQAAEISGVICSVEKQGPLW
jgi:hypothetical protein